MGKPYKPKYKAIEWDKLLLGNFKSGVTKDGRTWSGISPSPDKHRVPLWLWDECYHDYILARFDPEKAKKNQLTQLAYQYPNGLPPMILYLPKEPLLKRILDRIFFRRFLQSKGPGIVLTQPPVHAETILEIYNRTQDTEFLRECLPMLKKEYRYFKCERDPDNDNLISLYHPLEDGKDSSPEFDDALYGKWGGLPFARFIINYWLYRKHFKDGWDLTQVFKNFDFESQMFNALYALNLKALAEICKILDDPDEQEFNELGNKVTEALIAKCYDTDKKLFVSLYGKDEKKTKVKTVGSVIPIILDLPKEIVENLVGHLSNTLEFDTSYPVPSVSRDEQSFFPGRTRYLWRGTSWVNTNWYIVRGLVKHGYLDLAKNITKKTFDMVNIYGYREYYNSLSGEGYGDREHGWSTLLIDMLEITNQLNLLDKTSAE